MSTISAIAFLAQERIPASPIDGLSTFEAALRLSLLLTQLAAVAFDPDQAAIAASVHYEENAGEEEVP